MKTTYTIDRESLKLGENLNNKRGAVRYRRKVAAYDLAKLRGGDSVTVDAYNAAFDLLNRCILYALAQSRFDDSETERNYNSPYRLKKGARLDLRRVRLEKELEPYGCGFHRGYCIEDVYQLDGNGLPTGYGFLHFFD